MNPHYKEDCQDIDDFFKSIEAPKKKKSGPKPKAITINGQKFCAKCNQLLEFVNFSKDRSSKDSYCRYCKQCNKQERLRWIDRTDCKSSKKNYRKYVLKTKPKDPDFDFFKQYAIRPETLVKLQLKLGANLSEEINKVTDIKVLKRIYCHCNMYRLGRKSLTSREEIETINMNKEQLIDFFNQGAKNEMQ